jgi:hypothetical protein
LNAEQRREVERYLATGKSDLLLSAWEGDVFERGKRGKEDLIDALLAEVQHRAGGRKPRGVPEDLELQWFTRAKVEPMVRGLFPAAEREAVLRLLERSIVFVTSDSLETVVRSFSFLSSAWDVANLYLESVGAELLSDEAPRIVGLSEETRCFVSTDYFQPDGDRFADFILHETAHILHNCKRHTAGLPERRRREWLLDIDFHKRETFAYACEAYCRILELGRRPADRRVLLRELLDGALPNDERVNEDEYRAAVSEAVAARNGWKAILRRCAPAPAEQRAANRLALGRPPSAREVG